MDKYKYAIRALMCGMADVVEALCDGTDRASASASCLGEEVSRLADEVQELNKNLSMFLDALSEPKRPRRSNKRRRIRAKADYSIVN